MNRGFTVVEVLVTLVIMGILLGLGTIGVRSSLANGRDDERKSDIETIARGFEYRYDNGNALKSLPQTPTVDWPNPNAQGKGYYPGINEFIHMKGQQRTGFVPDTIVGGYIPKNIVGVSVQASTTPSGNTINQVCVSACQPAGNQAQLVTAFTSNPEGRDRYLYEAYDAAGNICSNGTCVGYNLYWTSETDTTVYKGVTGLKILRSKHQ